MSLQKTWVGNLRVNHDYPQHFWVAALRQAPDGVRGKELIIWDNGWEVKKEELIQKKKKLSINYGMIGGQRELYKYLKSPSKGKLNICKIWIAGTGTKDNCLADSVAWIQNILQTGGLDGDLAAMGFDNLCK